ncbi:PP2C family serine/threonine-protein phosphatase [Risungbinella massiliensis]|uniref:PP2C family serine/threonine-protein phosphatase n=1 Tax=Risungbinella massiliensis TaxID=1329796 RepID=UPI0005CB8A51|nr:PP2C family serine/threonine-protein phosphatase [Risungbinella massiliensis]
MSRTWRYLSSTVIGVSHEKDGTSCQDAHQCLLLPSREGETLFVSIIADGAGSATYGKEGATHICRYFLERIQSFLEQDSLQHITERHITDWLEQYQYEVSLWSACCRMESTNFASTLLGAIIGENRAIFWQIGDGAIVVKQKEKPNAYELIFWPQQGEYANQTYFATQPEACALLQFTSLSTELTDVALFTDGIQRLALSYEDQCAYAPFFRPLFEFLHHPDWNWIAGQKKLDLFLQSKQINKRTDDDKTLVIASRYLSRGTDDEQATY